MYNGQKLKYYLTNNILDDFKYNNIFDKLRFKFNYFILLFRGL